MSEEDYDRLPDTLELREIRIRVPKRGFRTKSLIVVTTLLDPDSYPSTDLAQLYRRRWQAELNFRSLKDVMRMDRL